ncbi:MAG: hypothetical protein E7643_07185, partial [Ruminococcaceae bacterium]|nr:hypothetical protein [Oscillospiraceae bacterium]
MNYTGVVRGFSSYTPEQREQLKKDLSLSFSERLLSFCMSYYKNAEKRDPYIDELQMLSALSSVLEKECTSLAVTELFTNDSFAADTYADLLQKRKSTHPQATSPCTLREIALVASRYLRRGTEKRLTNQILAAPEYFRELPTSPSSLCVAPADSPFRLRFLPCKPSASPSRDVLVLLTPAHGETVYRYARCCERFPEQASVAPVLRAVYTVQSGGLLRTLLEITDGLLIDLRAFSPFDSAMPMTVVTDSFVGHRILRVSENDLSALLCEIKASGLNGFPFACFSGDGRFTFVRDRDKSVSLETRFLTALSDSREISVRLPDEGQLPAEKICHRTVKDTDSAYLSDLDAAHCVATSVGGITCAASSASPEKAFFKTALYTTLAPALTLSLCGRDHTEQTFCIALEHPANPVDPYTGGECMAALLGIYRAQTELAIPSPNVILRPCPDAAHPSISVFSYAEAESAPSHLSLENGTVYCVSVPLDQNALPDFHALRTILREISAYRREGILGGARLLLGESVTGGLRSMQGAFTSRLTDTVVAPEAPLPMALLIESSKELPYRP